jgi:hypothetical protein
MMRARMLRLKDDKCGKKSVAPARRLSSAMAFERHDGQYNSC